MPVPITAKSELNKTLSAILTLEPIKPVSFRRTNSKETLLILEG